MSDRPDLTGAPQHVKQEYRRIRRRELSEARRNRRHPEAICPDETLEQLRQAALEDAMSLSQYLTTYHGDLTHDETVLLVLWVEHGYTEAEIGKMVGTSERTVRRQISAAKGKVDAAGR